MVFYMKIKQQKEDIANIKYGRDQNLRNVITPLKPQTIFNNKSIHERLRFVHLMAYKKIIL